MLQSRKVRDDDDDYYYDDMAQTFIRKFMKRYFPLISAFHTHTNTYFLLASLNDILIAFSLHDTHT